MAELNDSPLGQSLEFCSRSFTGLAIMMFGKFGDVLFGKAILVEKLPLRGDDRLPLILQWN